MSGISKRENGQYLQKHTTTTYNLFNNWGDKVVAQLAE